MIIRASLSGNVKECGQAKAANTDRESISVTTKAFSKENSFSYCNKLEFYLILKNWEKLV